MNFDIARTRNHLTRFDFESLFIEELGWEQAYQIQPDTLAVGDVTYTRHQVAHLSGVAVFELTADNGDIPNAQVRLRVYQQVSQQYHENLLIFVDATRTQSVWYWVKREHGKRHPRSHHFVKGQTGDLFLSKIRAMFVDIGELDEAGNLPVVEVARRLKDALDVERVTKRFYDEFKLAHTDFLARISGIDDENDRRWYASVLLNRLMFIYFLQRKGMIDRGEMDYLRQKLHESQERGSDRYYEEFLQLLFFEGFAKPRDKRSDAAKSFLGEIRYLNGGLFLRHPIEERWPEITIPDAAFEELFDLFSRYSWNLDDTHGGRDDEINPDVLGYIFEKYINQKQFGAYYTRPEITEYLCEQTIHRLILEKLQAMNRPIPGLPQPPQFDSVGELLLKLDAVRCRQLIHEVLPELRLLDPACGSGAFLVAAMRTLLEIYRAAVARIGFLKDGALDQWLTKVQQEHPHLDYFLKKQIITRNLFGVDIMAEAVEIAQLRLFLALVSSARTAEDLEPLPNIDFNILAGNSLMGLLRVDEQQYQKHVSPQMSLFQKSYQDAVSQKTNLIRVYQGATSLSEDLQVLRDRIQKHRQQATDTLDHILLDGFNSLRIKFEQATWDTQRNRAGKPRKRRLKLADMADLQPFHWGYEFHEVMNHDGGFDAILTNPPWEALKPQAKEFFAEYADVVTKNKMRIEEFRMEQKTLLRKPEIRDAWLDYLSRFPHQSAYFRKSEQYQHQRAEVNGRKTGSDINLYKLFVERCYALLRDGGHCGIVIPSGLYTDLGATGLRKLLFEYTQIRGLFGFENRKAIFEGVHRSFKIVVLTFTRGGHTERFPAAFMRHDVEGLGHFPGANNLELSMDLIRRFSPGSLSVMEFDSLLDVDITQKMLRFPTLGENLAGTWNLKLTREFDMTNDSRLFQTDAASDRLPLYEGKMIHQYEHRLSEPRYWVNEEDARAKLLRGKADTGQALDYQRHRLGFRDVARNTDQRTMIAGVLPKDVFAGNTVIVSISLINHELLLVAALLNSFAFDSIIRRKVTAHCNMFYVYQVPVPRLTIDDRMFAPIVERAARLVCTTPEFDDLAQEVGLEDHRQGATRPAERARLRAELDGIIAHVYGLTEAEFAHILSTFPLVPEPIKVAAQNAYRDVEKGVLS